MSIQSPFAVQPAGLTLSLQPINAGASLRDQACAMLRSIVDHLRIIEALEKRDTELAEKMARQHSLDLADHVERNCDFLD
jgi:DNA-binding GntR family transcriptional regulator